MKIFKVGGTFERSCIFTGGSMMYEIVAINNKEMTTKCIDFEIDGTHERLETFEIKTNNIGEYITLWSYKGEEGIMQAGFDLWGNEIY